MIYMAMEHLNTKIINYHKNIKKQGQIIKIVL